jgi:hypothetical protein
LIGLHASLLRLPYYWDEAGYYIPAARDLFAGSLIPHSTPSNAHPPLVMAWIALWWKVFGQAVVVTRCAMLLLAAFSLLGFFRLARTVANTAVAAGSTLLVAIYPVFFAQSSLAQIDLPSAGLIFWGLEPYFKNQKSGRAVESETRQFSLVHRWPALCWFSLAVLTKETAILVPLALFVWEFVSRFISKKSPSLAGGAEEGASGGKNLARALRIGGTNVANSVLLLIPVIPLAAWYAYHYARTGRVFGNPEFFRYNVQGTLHPLRIFLALLLRTWQAVGYLDLYVLTIACLVAMTFRPIKTAQGERPRISVPIQMALLAIVLAYLLVLSVVGGAVLARYMLPVVPLVILISVSTIWRRLPAWKAVVAVVGLAFISGLFINPPYGFAPEDNLAYRDYIRLHQRAEAFLLHRYPNGRVLTAWPASDELTRPYLGYVQKPLQVVRIEDFSAEQLLSAADQRVPFDVALVFSTKYQPHTLLDGWQRWRRWKSRYFDFHVDLPPEAAVSVLGGELIYTERRRGQWVGIIAIEKIEEADVR